MHGNEQDGTRRWAGEALFCDQAESGRAVEIRPSDGARFKAHGRAGEKSVFEIQLRPEQVERFRRAMEREGAAVTGAQGSAAGGDSEPRGSIGTEGVQTPPPTEPKALLPEEDSNPRLLLADAQTGKPVLGDGALRRDAVAYATRLADRLGRPEYLGDEGADPNDLSLQRWGVVAPEGRAGEELLELIRPLIAWREEQQGAKVMISRAPPNQTAEAANAWIKSTYRTPAIPAHERPGYVLILGDLSQLSAELQQRLGASAYVGRLCFDGPEGYRAYVDKLLRHERSAPRREARALFFTAHDGSGETATGYRSLVVPALEMCEAIPRRRYPVREVLEIGDPDDWSQATLLSAARDANPSVLFTLSHGASLRNTEPYAHRRALQGAMCLGRGELTAEHVARGAFLPGGAWFFLACLSAGTPARSVYRPWLQRLAQDGEAGLAVERVLSHLPRRGEDPFIAALPRAALANPEGPLAVIGHLDLAWTYSFHDPEGARRPERFVEVVKHLWSGRRVGIALKTLLLHAVAVEGDLIARGQADAELEPDDPPTREMVHRGHLWMARHDLCGFVLLGDPAARVREP